MSVSAETKPKKSLGELMAVLKRILEEDTQPFAACQLARLPQAHFGYCNKTIPK